MIDMNNPIALADALSKAKAHIRALMNEIDANHFGSIHTLSPDHPNRAAYDRAAEFLAASK